MNEPVTSTTPVSLTAPLPVASGESTGAAVSPPAAPVVAPSPVAEPVTPVVVTPEPAAALTHDFKPSILESEGAPEPAAPTPPAVDPAAPVIPAAEPPKDPAAPVTRPADAVVETAQAPEPVAYEFRFPENVDPQAVDKPVLDKYTSILNKSPVPQDVAQELLDLHLDQARAIETRLSERQWDVFNGQQEAWQNQVKEDPELGGSRIKTVMRTAASFIEKFGGSPAQQKAIMDVMRTTGAGNHPEVLRLFYRAGEVLAREPQARNMPPARQIPLTREQKQAARYK